MKLLFSCIIFLAALAWSNIFTLSGSIFFEKGYLNIDTTKICDVDTSYINCSLEKGLAYYSTLDTNFAVFSQPRFGQIYVAIPSYDIANPAAYSHTITQVIRYEFMKWQEWGFFDLTRDSAQHLIDRILPESENMNNRNISHKKVCDTDPSQCLGWGAYGGGSGISDEEASRLPQKKYQIDMSEGLADTTENPLGIQQNFTPLPQIVPPGTSYKAFDMNGIYLYRGAWDGNFTVHTNPVILKFNNGRTAVFR
ncbi:MAG: hypothetical protein HUK21_00425 [Fibrobacteraceae bacterium]|nr:hypothetical protein [Fibrobacteraceae bacterium]